MKWLNRILNIFKKKEVETPKVPEVKPPVTQTPIPTPSIDVDTLGITILARVSTELANVKKTILNNRELYEAVENATGVPWRVVAACHYRESSLNFKGVLHNGEYIIGTGKLTKLVPKGRGPFSSWHEAAIDAMDLERGKFPAVWDLQGQLDFCERYNGLGYKKKGIPSPYVYAGTSKYQSGLYIADGKFSSSTVDKRLGCAPIILSLI